MTRYKNVSHEQVLGHCLSRMGCGSSSAATPVHLEGAYGVVDLHPSGAVKPCKEFVVMDGAEKHAGSREHEARHRAPVQVTSSSTPDQDVAAQCVTENAGGQYSKAQALAAASSSNSQGTMAAHASASFTSKRAFTSAPMFASNRRFGSQGRLY